MSDTAQRYDAVPYPALVHPWSHPRALGAMAILHGVDAAPIERCRVMEIGCGTGRNLISMAFDQPDSTFVGVDLSSGQIATAEQRKDALGLTNVDLFATDLADFEDALGFDYIVAHGVYTWVDAPTRSALLATARRLLKPEGVLYVSYNCYPGWHLANMVRDLFQRRTDPSAAPLERARQGRAVLEAAVQAADPRGLVGATLQSELDSIAVTDDAYIVHEYLEPTQGAVYFEDLARHGAEHGLRYVANAEPRRQLASTQSPALRDAMGSADGRIAQQQILDHVVGTRFRRTLLCRSDHAEPGLTMVGLGRLHARLASSEVVQHEGNQIVLELGDDRRIRMPPGPLADWVGGLAEAWPCSVPMAGWLEAAGAHADAAGQAVVQLFFAGAVELGLSPVSAARELSERPVGSPLAQVQARFDPLVCSRDHRSESLEPLEWDVLQALDGTKTLNEVAQALGADPDDVQRMAQGLLERCLLVG